MRNQKLASPSNAFLSRILLILLLFGITGCTSLTPSSRQGDIIPAYIQAGAAVITAVFVSGIGTIIGISYRKRELDIARAEAIRKFFETLLNTESQQRGGTDEHHVQAALFAISTLGDPKFAIQLAELMATQKPGAIYALDRFASNSDRYVSRLARSALENIMNKPHFWKNSTETVLDRARAYKLIEDVIKGHRSYSEVEIFSIFEKARRSETGMETDLASCLEIYRLDAIYGLLNLSPETEAFNIYNMFYSWKENRIRKEFENMIPLFKAIILLNKGNPQHSDFAHLAYVYKDSSRAPKWGEVKHNIEQAITLLEREGEKISSESLENCLIVYEFNNLLCDINTSKDDDDMHAKLLQYQSRGKKYVSEFINSHRILKPGLDKIKGKSLLLLNKWKKQQEGKK